MDELGSGIRNTTKYAKSYSGGTPLFIEGDIFQTIIPLEKSKNDQASDQVNELEIGDLAGHIALQQKVASFARHQGREPKSNSTSQSKARATYASTY